MVLARLRGEFTVPRRSARARTSSIGWPRERDGRKHLLGDAIFDADQPSVARTGRAVDRVRDGPDRRRAMRSPGGHRLAHGDVVDPQHLGAGA